jgi:hypothetical protein
VKEKSHLMALMTSALMAAYLHLHVIVGIFSLCDTEIYLRMVNKFFSSSSNSVCVSLRNHHVNEFQRYDRRIGEATN